jgi:hypothetical protein
VIEVFPAVLDWLTDMAYLWTTPDERASDEIVAVRRTVAEYCSKTLLILRNRKYPREDDDGA